MNRKEFVPDWTSSPGETIVDILGERGLSEVEFARQIGYTSQQVQELLQGRATISLSTARKLKQVLGGSVEFWISRDFQYRQDSERFRGADQEWLAELPIGDMVKFGWLTPAPRPSEELAASLHFFDVTSIQAWREKYSDLRQLAIFRTSPSFDSQPGAVIAWLRWGEVEADTIECAPWNAHSFKESLTVIRSLTRQKDPRRFLEELRQLCAQSGVAVVVARAPSGCRASGATCFLSPNKALLMLSFRYLTDDQFWFTFFHEAGHLMLHEQRRGIFLEGLDTPSATSEREANEFAARILVPAEQQSQLMALRSNARDVIRFAVHLGIAPGIVVGQLQNLGKINYNQLNRLKRRYEWQS